MTFVVKRIDDRLVKTSLPGQYVTVRCRCPTGSANRASTASPAPTTGSTASSRSSGCAAPASPTARSPRCCATRSQVGDVLTMSLPYGDVVLDDSGRPVVFASAGIGITPMAGMLSHLAAAGSGLQIMLLHADETRAPFALRRQVVSDVLALPNASLHVWYEKGAASHEPVDGVHAGLMNLADVTLPDNAWLLPVRPDAVHAGGAQRADRARVSRPPTSSTRCSAPTCGRPTSTERPRARNGFRRGTDSMRCDRSCGATTFAGHLRSSTFTIARHRASSPFF